MPSSRPSLLFLCQTLPFPPDGGVNIRTYNVLRLLAQTFDIDAVCFYRRGVARSLQKSEEGLRPLVRSLRIFPIEQETSRTRWLRDHLRSSFTATVYTRHTYEHHEARAALEQLLAQHRYDLVHVDSLDLSAYLPLFQRLPVVCVHHNVESLLLERRARVDTNPVRRAYLRLQARLMRREEEYWAPRVALNVTCSPEDKRALEQIAPGAAVLIVPNGVDVHHFTPPSSDVGRASSGLVFVGGMTWFPNADGMHWFTEEILPLLEQRGRRPDVTWVGRARPEAVDAYAAHGVRLTGYVDDIRPYVHSARCYIVPLRVGGGTRLKLLDAWAMGQAVVSTTIGAEGLEARDGENILLADSPDEFAQAVRRVLADATLRERLATNARRTALESYGWETIGAAMQAAYLRLQTTQLVDRPKPSGS